LDRTVIENWFMFRNACILTREWAAAPVGPLATTQNEILFLHGRYGNASEWELLSEALGEHTNCRSIELPGFGRSFFVDDRDFSFHEYIELAVDFYKVPTSTSPERRIMVGHDFGALIAQMAAVELSRLHQPIHVDLVLLSPCAFAETFETTLMERSPVNQLGRWFAEKRLKKLFKRSPLLKKPTRKLLQPAPRKILNRIEESWPGPMERQVWTRLMKHYPGSLLVLRGANDPLNSSDCTQEILNSYRNVEYFEHAGAGHWPLLEDPEWVVTKMREFLFRTQGSVLKSS
jgi:pimeloyl-ACP methyl ester carboxylesterase